MAMSPKSISFLFLLITLFFSTQIHARDSQFFSKVSGSTSNEKEATTTSSASQTNQPEQEPTFIPQTQNDNYGLYGNQYQHETNTQIPTTTKLAGSLEESNAKTNSENHYYYHPNTNNNAYEEQQQRKRDQQEQREEDRFVQTSLQDVENSEYPSKTNTNTESKSTNQNQYYYNTNTNNNNNKERQGMSDTRYLENGRYFYDLANEMNMFYDPNSQFKSTGTSYTTTTTPQGYYNNYNNNEQFNPKGNYPEEEEFHASENEQYVP